MPESDLLIRETSKVESIGEANILFGTLSQSLSFDPDVAT